VQQLAERRVAMQQRQHIHLLQGRLLLHQVVVTDSRSSVVVVGSKLDQAGAIPTYTSCFLGLELSYPCSQELREGKRH
jgi:hypothetical protein